MFDYRGIHHYRYAKKCYNAHFLVDAKDPTYDEERQLVICEAETGVIKEAIHHVVQQNCLPTNIETGISIVSGAITGEWHEKKKMKKR